MLTYSQKDEKYRNEKLGNSKLTVGAAGCVVQSLATIFQVDPTVILAMKDCFNAKGEANIGEIVRRLGGKALPRTTKAPKGWCIAITDNYAPTWPTHFFPVNVDAKKQVDPLDNPAKVEELAGYRITQYLPFEGVKFDHTKVDPPGPFADVPLTRGDAAAIGRLKDQGVIKGYPDGTYRPDDMITRGEAAIMIDRAKNG